MGKDGKQNYYEILDVSLNANPEVIRTSYIRAKNAYNRDSLAAYSLFDKEDSKKILDEIEEAFSVLSDSEKRRKYDESHGIITSESIYESYHRGNHAVAAFSRQALQEAENDRFSFEEDPFRKSQQAPAEQKPKLEAAPVEKRSSAAIASTSFQMDPAMEEKLQKCEGVSGNFLKEAREYKQLSADDMMNILKISRNYLVALESDDISKLPANVFVRGFVMQYARALRLDQEKLTAAYMEFLRSKRGS